MNPFLPQASTMAGPVDALLVGLLAVATGVAGLVCTLVVAFAIRYRAGSTASREGGTPPVWLEVLWFAAPTAVGLGLFAWGAELYVRQSRAPVAALDVHVIGKQWMWKVYHPGGQREINELHVPAGQPVNLTLASEDVIHSFFVPAFRLKNDVVPGHYTALWFEASRPGRYHLFCAEYCGARHAGMVGTVTVLEPAAWTEWLSGRPAGESPREAGARLYRTQGCAACHDPGPAARGPRLDRPGGVVALAGGGSAKVDRAYLRESIVDPGARVVAGYVPSMPSYRGVLSEEELDALVTFLDSSRMAAPR